MSLFLKITSKMKFLIIIISLIIMVFAIILFIGWVFSSPGYKGPVSDHFDGKKFVNPGIVKSNGFRELIKWSRNRQPGAWEEVRNAVYGPPPPARVDGDSIRVTFVNHSTFLIQFMNLNILTDPVWSERASPVGFAGPKRMRPPGIRMEDLPDIDIVLLTHNHYDHLDIKTMKRLSREHKPVIYCPLGVGRYLERRGIGNFVEMDWWKEVEFNRDLAIVCTPSQHFSGRGMFDRDRTLWSGFALKSGSGSIYYAGDTGYGDFFREIAERIGPVSLAFIPIGAFKPEWFMAPIHTSPADALKVQDDLGGPVSIAMHFGTFPLADDGQGEAENDLLQLMKERQAEKREFIVPVEGKGMVFYF